MPNNRFERDAAKSATPLKRSVICEDQSLVNIYGQHFTLDELKRLNQFYSTDLGHKLISTMPSVLQEGMAAGQKWGQTLAPEIGRRIQARFKKEAIAL